MVKQLKYLINIKRGNVSFFIVTIGIIFSIMILFAFFLTYTQVINMVMNIKEDLYYVVSNSLLGFDKNELAYDNYVFDEEQMKNICENILNKNYLKEGVDENKFIKEINIKELKVYSSEEAYIHTLGRYKSPIIHILIELKFIPIIKFKDQESYNIIIHEDVKMELLKYEVT